jgi:hydrogenase maturation protease
LHFLRGAFPEIASAPGMISDDRSPVLVIGIGNPDRGDDGVGLAAARRLRGQLPPGTNVIERVALLEDWEGSSSVILIDAVAPMTQPGRVHRFDLTKNPLPVAFATASTHAFGLAETVELARSLGRLPDSVIAFLVEGEQFAAGAPLSPPVAKAVEPVVEQILTEITATSEGSHPPCMRRRSFAMWCVASTISPARRRRHA